jgi:release factor glutamine methyltransferase
MPRAAPADANRAAVIARLRAAGCVFAEDEADALMGTATSPAALSTMVDQRVAGLPLEHVLGFVEFDGLRIDLDPGVFVPRRRTELLAREAAALVPTTVPAGRVPVVVDLACGCGAIGLAVASRLGQASPLDQGSRLRRIRLVAVDIDPAAVACARRNLAPLRGQVLTGDLFDPLPAGLGGRVDLIVANLPYVPTGFLDLLPREARLHEPRIALDGGPDGLDLLRRVASGAGDWLRPGGHLLIEVGEEQVAAALGEFTAGGLAASVVVDAEHGATVVVGRADRSRAGARGGSARAQAPGKPRAAGRGSAQDEA